MRAMCALLLLCVAALATLTPGTIAAAPQAPQVTVTLVRWPYT
jgi:hypothetical protein